MRLTSVVGREAELGALAELLPRTRLLTLTGAGGSGKTTLALEVARRAAYAHEDGARFVDLQAVRGTDAVGTEIARAVGLHDGPLGSRAARLPAYLAEREMLLVLDNFEQVVDAAEGLTDLLRASPRSRIIITSRVRLNLSMEQEYAVRPLAVDAAGEGHPAAVRLFLERARRVRPELILDDKGHEAVRGICRLVDGLPLAIELCAARVATLPVSVIEDRLRRHLPLPGSSPRDVPARQRTLEDTLDWSLELLSPALRTLFARLAIFEESFELEQAEQVCGLLDGSAGDVLEGLTTLTEQNLLHPVDDPLEGLRLRMLETVRAVARSRLVDAVEEQDLRDAHAHAFAELAERAAPHLPGAEQVRWLDRLEADAANLRSAARHAIDHGEVDLALRLVGSLWRFWLQSGRLSEGAALIESALALPGAEAPTRLRIAALDAAGSVAYWSGDMARADALYERELVLARELGDEAVEAPAWLNLFFTRENAGDYAGADAAKDAALRLYRAAGDDEGVTRAEASSSIGGAARAAVDDSAVALLEARLERLEHETDPWLRREIFTTQGKLAWLRGDMLGASRALVRSVRAAIDYRELGDAALMAQFLVVACMALDLPELAAVAHGTVWAEHERLGIRAPAPLREIAGVDPLPVIEDALGPDGFAAAVQRGRRMDLSRLIELVDDATKASLHPDDREALSVELATLLEEAQAGEIRAGATTRPPMRDAGSCFTRQGDIWTIRYAGVEVRLRHALGLQYLAQLLATPGGEIAALDLVASRAAHLAAASAASVAEAGLRADRGRGVEASDRQSLAEYRARLVELQDEIDDAERSSDPGTASRRREELELLTSHITTTFGLGGRPRESASPAERARQSVTKAIRSAVGRIARAHPALGEHFAHSVRTGRYCTYDPDPTALPTWVL